MTPAGEILAREIEASGPVSFHRYMDVALYHPEHGYYRRPKDPFGKHGDFFTAAQLQPVFGILMAASVRMLCEEMGRPPGFTVVELGAGRGEMGPAFSEFEYLPVDVERNELPAEFTGVVFANEFFDALPVEAYVRRSGTFHEMRVGFSGERFGWVDGTEAAGEAAEYLERYAGNAAEGQMVEVNLEALRWLERISRSLKRGYLVAIDYGYTRRELIRFQAGTLMSYRRHTAEEDVLDRPGDRDITAHVHFTALQEHGASIGLTTVRFENLAQTLLRAGEGDQFAAALRAESERENEARKLQLKTLLFGMGETFRTWLARAEGNAALRFPDSSAR